MEHIQQSRCRELANSSSFYRTVYSEIEEVGWEHLGRLSGDLEFLSFRVSDSKGRVHCLEIKLDKNYPRSPPSISMGVPYIFSLKWSTNSRLKDLLQQAQEHLEKLQEFWIMLDEIDKSLWIVDTKQPSCADACRQINLGNDCFIMFCIHADDPRSLPECRFMGSDPTVKSLRKTWQRNSKRWNKDKPFLENAANILETQLPRRPVDHQNNDHQVECGICYAQVLPVDDELGAKSGSGIDYTCDNTSCSRAFHSVCLGDWLRSITTTRQSYDVLFGNCPYCSEPVAVKINNVKRLRKHPALPTCCTLNIGYVHFLNIDRDLSIMCGVAFYPLCFVVSLIHWLLVLIVVFTPDGVHGDLPKRFRLSQLYDL